jgi:hypothetical protein
MPDQQRDCNRKTISTKRLKILIGRIAASLLRSSVLSILIADRLDRHGDTHKKGVEKIFVPLSHRSHAALYCLNAYSKIEDLSLSQFPGSDPDFRFRSCSCLLERSIKNRLGVMRISL